MDRLQAMRAFARVADEGGFAAAARALDWSPPVVTRRWPSWSAAGTRLLQRTTRKVALTEAGQAYLHRVRAPSSKEATTPKPPATASTRDLRGTLHLMASPVLATHFLGPLMVPWRERIPGCCWMSVWMSGPPLWRSLMPR